MDESTSPYGLRLTKMEIPLMLWFRAEEINEPYCGFLGSCLKGRGLYSEK
jgi:hypothetical protein